MSAAEYFPEVPVHRTVYTVLFERDDGVTEWWDVLFRDQDEARRWAEHELRRKRRRKGDWRAVIDEGDWDGIEPVFNGGSQTVIQAP